MFHGVKNKMQEKKTEDYVKIFKQLSNPSLLALLVYVAAQLQNTYHEFNDNLTANTQANQELLELHREWFKAARPDYRGEYQ